MMNRFLRGVCRHSTMVAVAAALLLLASAAALILRPAVVVQLLRYGAAAVNTALGIWIIVALLRKR